MFGLGNLFELCDRRISIQTVAHHQSQECEHKQAMPERESEIVDHSIGFRAMQLTAR